MKTIQFSKPAPTVRLQYADGQVHEFQTIDGALRYHAQEDSRSCELQMWDEISQMWHSFEQVGRAA